MQKPSLLKKRIAFTLVALLLLLLGFGLGYRTGFSEGRERARVFVEEDRSDVQEIPVRAKAGYDTYYSKRNAIPDLAR